MYSRAQAVSSGKSMEECIEMIDIGGPTLVRAAAKNYESVVVVTSPSQYGDLIKELQENQGTVSKATRLALAREAFISIARFVGCRDYIFTHLY